MTFIMQNPVFGDSIKSCPKGKGNRTTGSENNLGE